MTRFMEWIKEHPLTAAALGLGLGWAIKVSLREYMPEHMEARYRTGPGPEPMKAKSLRQGDIKRGARPAGRPGGLSGEFRDLLEEPPAI